MSTQIFDEDTKEYRDAYEVVEELRTVSWRYLDLFMAARAYLAAEQAYIDVKQSDCETDDAWAARAREAIGVMRAARVRLVNVVNK